MNLQSVSGWFSSGLFFGNTPETYGLAAVAFTVALTLLRLVKNIGVVRLKALAGRTETDLDDLALELIGKFSWTEYQLAAVFVATRYLQRSAGFDKSFRVVILLVFTYRAITLAQHLLSYWIKKLAARRELSEEAKASVVNSTQVIMRALVWIAAALFVLENLGVNISAVLTGLGIGGVAVALASQAILGDLFNFFVILLDKPFLVGDFIATDTLSGTVEHIGLKSIRIRSLSGELVVVSNSRLLGMEVKNYKHLTRRRVVTKTSVTYQTPQEKLKLVPALLKEAACLKDVTFDRSNLCSLGDSSLDFETVYYVESQDYNLHMKLQEAFLQGIVARFQKEGIEFAYPTQTLFVHEREQEAIKR